VFLVDTSVWIDFFKASANPAVQRLKEVLSAGVEIGVSTTATILQEILKGTADEQQFFKYRSYFETQPIYLPRDPIRSAIAAARLYFDCRRQGITVRSSNDCLIAQTALEYGLILLHNDEDFRHMGKVLKDLKQTSS
jgi:predicted nucleic acid-binding protein